jgi:hypothetical protein
MGCDLDENTNVGFKVALAEEAGTVCLALSLLKNKSPVFLKGFKRAGAPGMVGNSVGSYTVSFVLAMV